MVAHPFALEADPVTDLWTSLLPLILGSAILPLQIAITVLLLRSGAGTAAAIAWVAGMTVVRLAQGVVFGLVLDRAAMANGETGTGLIASTLLLLVGILFLITAAKQLLREPDDDAPSPRWMALVEAASPGRSFLFGTGIVGMSAKLWAFTLGAIGAIAEADLGQPGASLVFLVFVVAAESVHIGAIAITLAAPDRAGALLDRLSDGLQRYNRAIMITLGLVFGIWFLLKALRGFGVL